MLALGGVEARPKTRERAGLNRKKMLEAKKNFEGRASIFFVSLFLFEHVNALSRFSTKPPAQTLAGLPNLSRSLPLARATEQLASSSSVLGRESQD